MRGRSAIVARLLPLLTLALEVGAWDELGPLDKARRAHPEFFRKGAVNQVEIDGEMYWVFTGDGTKEGGRFTSDAEAYREAALEARRNLLRHVADCASHVDAEVSGIVTAYRFAEGKSRRVVCLVPVENVALLIAKSAGVPPAAAETSPDARSRGSAAPPIAESAGVPPAAAETSPDARSRGSAVPPIADDDVAPPSLESAGLPPAAPPKDDAHEPAPFGGMKRFSSPSLPTPTIP